MKKTMKTISRAVSLAAVAAVGFTLLAGAPAQAAVGEVEPIDDLGAILQERIRAGEPVFRPDAPRG